MPSTHFLIRIALWCALAVIAFGLFLSVTLHTDAIALSAARVRLFDGDHRGAANAFLGLRGSWWVGKDAETGLIISLILAGERDAQISGSVHRDAAIGPFALPLLLKQQLSAGDYPRLHRLARFGSLFDLPAARLFEAAALVEMGRTEEAAVAYAATPDAVRATPLGRAVAEVLPLLEEGAVCIVRDRDGRILGWTTTEGTFHGAAPEMREYLQPVYLHAVTREAGAHGLRLALDLDLSRMARSLLDGNSGSIVLLDPPSGDVLAAVSDAATRFGGDVESSPAFEQQLEPASISKLVTTVAAYRAGLDPDALIDEMICRGSKQYGGEILYCASVLGRLDGLDHAMRGSCNVAFADLGVMVGWEGMVRELHNFGFDSSVGNPFPLGFIVAGRGTARQLADLSIGLNETRITVLHGAMLGAVFGNDGILVKPNLVKARDGYLGMSTRMLLPHEGVRVVEKEWMAPIVSSMRAVSEWGGTAAQIAPDDFPVAMKTGTGGTWRDGFHINYVGFGPADRARVAFSVRVTGKRRSATAQNAGYQVTEQLLYRLRDHFRTYE